MQVLGNLCVSKDGNDNYSLDISPLIEINKYLNTLEKSNNFLKKLSIGVLNEKVKIEKNFNYLKNHYSLLKAYNNKIIKLHEQKKNLIDSLIKGRSEQEENIKKANQTIEENETEIKNKTLEITLKTIYSENLEKQMKVKDKQIELLTKSTIETFWWQHSRIAAGAYFGLGAATTIGLFKLYSYIRPNQNE